MPERNHEVIIDGFVFPDTVTVTLANDEYIDSRDYVDKELYESICAANDAWQEQNAKLREERDMYRDLVDCMVHPDVPDQLAAENAKLRDLALNCYRMLGFALPGGMCKTRCSHWPECEEPGPDGVERCQLEELARELGMEVEQ